MGYIKVMPEERYPIEALRVTFGDWLSLKQAARVLEVSEETVRRYANADVGSSDFLPCLQLGGKLTIPRAAIVAFINAHAKGIEFYDPGFEPEPDPNDVQEPLD